MPSEHTSRRIIEFAETDMAGIVHFSNFFRYMEATEHEFFRAHGLVVHASSDQGMLGWARVHAACDYQSPLKYLDQVEIRLFVENKTRSALSYRFQFFRLDEEPILAALGEMRVVCITRLRAEQKIRAQRIPDDVDALIQIAPGKPWELH